MSGMSYKEAGVDIEVGDAIVDNIKASVSRTHNANVLAPLGGFAGLYDLKSLLTEYNSPVLVQSIDGVGTKSIVASLSDNFTSIGQDLVSATSNDILVCGAKPLTLLDYVASSHLSVEHTSTVIKSIADACYEQGVALVGGETAEMPDTYCDNAYDIVGIVTGVVDREKIIDGQALSEGHVILGVSSSGLHTNGYSLARRVLFDKAGFSVDKVIDELGMTVGEALLAPHKNYQTVVHEILNDGITISAMAHITGGGLPGNLSRVLPKGLNARIDSKAIPGSTLFSLIQNLGQVSTEDMLSTFNMGVGYVFVCPESEADKLTQVAKQCGELVFSLGRIVQGEQKVEIV